MISYEIEKTKLPNNDKSNTRSSQEIDHAERDHNAININTSDSFGHQIETTSHIEALQTVDALSIPQNLPPQNPDPQNPVPQNPSHNPLQPLSIGLSIFLLSIEKIFLSYNSIANDTLVLASIQRFINTLSTFFINNNNENIYEINGIKSSNGESIKIKTAEMNKFFVSYVYNYIYIFICICDMHR